MHIGQKVICINDNNQFDIKEPNPSVIKGEIYTIRGFSSITKGLYLEGLILEEIEPGIERAFCRTRFREIDFSFGEEVVEKVLAKIEEKRLEIIF